MTLRSSILNGCAYLVVCGVALAQNPADGNQTGKETARPSAVTSSSYAPELVQKGAAIFRQDCSFCHGREAGGGESGPDLTRSKLVAQDMNGDKIGAVVRNGRPDKGMPPFDTSDDEITSLTAFIHTQRNISLSSSDRRKGAGGRKGVDVSDLQTGNVEAGERYFKGTGGCVNCHSAAGDLAGIAKRYKGLELEEQMLYPKHARPKITVTLSSGQTITGRLAYEDEFVIGMTDESGVYHSWRVRDVHYQVDSGLKTHVELFSKYSDEDVHNLMAYLQTLQ